MTAHAASELYESGAVSVGEPGGNDAPAGSATRLFPFQPGATTATVGPHVPDRRSSFDHRVAAHEGGHILTSRLCGLVVAGSTINRVGDHFGETWSCDDDTGSGSVADLCSALAPLMPPLFDDRRDIAAELSRAHHQVVALLAGPLAEEIFTGERLPGSAHDETEATAIGALVCRSASSLPAYSPAPRPARCCSITPPPSSRAPTRWSNIARSTVARLI